MTLDMSNMTAHQLLMKLDEYKATAQVSGEKFVELETLARELKMKSEATLAWLISSNITAGDSYNVAKVRASCDEAYKSCLDEQSHAEHEMNLMKIEYDLAKASIRTLESIAYVRNNELKMTRG